MQKKVINWFDHFLNDAYALSQENLALYRICFAAYFLLFGLPTFSWISQNPQIFFNPPQYSFAAFFSSFPPYWFFVSLDLSICILFLLLLFGYKTRTVSILLTLFLIVGNSFRFSFGKIDHGIIPILIPFFMAFSGWGNKLSLDNKFKKGSYPPQSGLPITLIAVILGFGFFSAGFPKLLTWIDFDLATQGVRGWVIRGYYSLGRHEFLLPYFAEVQNPLFWELLDITAVLFELGFFFSVFKPKIFKIFVGIAVLFHLNNLLMLNISFIVHLVVYLLFIDWNWIKNKINTELLSKSLITANNLTLSLLIYLSLFVFFYHLSDSVPQLLGFSPFVLLLDVFVQSPILIMQLLLLSIATLIVCGMTAKKIKANFSHQH